MINKPSIREIRQSFSFNKNLIEITFYENLELIVFKFWNSKLRHGKEIDTFEIGSNGCDLDSFEEFGNSCINSFCGGSLTNSQVRERANEIFNSLFIFLKEKAKNFFLNTKSNTTINIKQNKIKKEFSLSKRFDNKDKFGTDKAVFIITIYFHYMNLLY